MAATRYCPECGGEMKYDPPVKSYSCTKCGLSLTHQQLVEARGQGPEGDEEDQRRQHRREYLKWWLSKKEK